MRRTSLIERMEERRLLAAAPGAAYPIDFVDGMATTQIEWRGQAARMFAGQWMVQLDGYSGSRTDQGNRLSKALQGSSIVVSEYLGSDGLFLVKAPTSLSHAQVQGQLNALPGARFSEPNFVYELQNTRVPNDPSYSQLWGMNQANDIDIDAPEAWFRNTGSSDVVVAVVDSGFDYNHPDLTANGWINTREIAGNNIDDDANGYVDDIRGWDFWGNATSDGPGDADPLDQNNHGTHVSGTIAARGNNSVGVVGVNWQSRILSMKIGGSGPSVSGADAVTAYNYLTALRQRGENIRVANNSWGGGGFSQAMLNAIVAAGNAGILTVAAAGNNGSSTIFYPAGYNTDFVISVGSITNTGARSSFSNFGTSWVDIGAPGSGILSTVRNGGYSSFNGTSMASPHVAGAAALAWSFNGNLTPAQVRTAILSSGDVSSTYATLWNTSARLNVNNMLNLLPPPIAAPLAPSRPILSTNSDTGLFSNDGITADNTPTFTGTAEPNSTVRLMLGATQIGQGAADAQGNFSVTTATLLDGNYNITATASNAGGTSQASQSFAITVDTVGPVISSGAFEFETGQSFVFNVDTSAVAASVAGSSVTTTNLTNSTVVPSANTSVSYNPANGRLAVTYTGNTLANGNYSASVASNALTDLAGNGLTGTSLYSFFVLAGDADRNRTVEFTDLLRLANNYNQAGTFSQGDYNYSGIVDFADLLILAQSYGTLLPQAQLAPTNTPTRGSVRGDVLA